MWDPLLVLEGEGKFTEKFLLMNSFCEILREITFSFFSITFFFFFQIIVLCKKEKKKERYVKGVKSPSL